MKTQNPPSPAKVAAARVNGRRGGTKSPAISRWNALKHAATAGLSIVEGKHLPEYGDIIHLRDKLINELARIGPLTFEDLVTIDKFINDLWRSRRSLRHEFRETEKDQPMALPGMANMLRYISLADRQLAASLARITAIRERLTAACAAEVSLTRDAETEGQGTDTPEEG